MMLNLYCPDLLLQSEGAGVLDFKSGDLISTSCREMCMQEYYFVSSHCIERVCIIFGTVCAKLF